MKVIFTKQFDKMFVKLRGKEKMRVKQAIAKFKSNPFDITLRNHALTGKMQDSRSIAAGGDLRIIFREEGDYVLVIMLAVGSHAKLYG